jgi:integrase
MRGLTLKEPKSKAGKRVVSLGTEAIAALRSRLKKAQEEGFDAEQVPIVFPNNLGGYMRGSNFDRNVWYPIRKAAGLSDTFVFHDLRHTQASLTQAPQLAKKPSTGKIFRPCFLQAVFVSRWESV